MIYVFPLTWDSWFRLFILMIALDATTIEYRIIISGINQLALLAFTTSFMTVILGSAFSSDILEVASKVGIT